MAHKVAKLRHLPVDERVLFPSSHPEWEMPESGRHGRLCELLYLVLRAAAGRSSTAGKDHFVYYDRKDPRRCLAPDAFVKLGVPHHLVESWKTWHLGVPELCVEILSPSDTEETLTFREKLRRYNALKPRELIVFRADGRPGRRLRAWDRTKGILVERIVSKERTPCRTLDAFFVIRDEPEIGPALRLVDGSGNLVRTHGEAREAELLASAHAREAELLASAHAREAELLAEIARLARKSAKKR